MLCYDNIYMLVLLLHFTIYVKTTNRNIPKLAMQCREPYKHVMSILTDRQTDTALYTHPHPHTCIKGGTSLKDMSGAIYKCSVIPIHLYTRCRNK